MQQQHCEHRLLITIASRSATKNGNDVDDDDDDDANNTGASNTNNKFNWNGQSERIFTTKQSLQTDRPNIVSEEETHTHTYINTRM